MLLSLAVLKKTCETTVLKATLGRPRSAGNVLACAANLNSETLHELLQFQQVRAPNGSGANYFGLYVTLGAYMPHSRKAGLRKQVHLRSLLGFLSEDFEDLTWLIVETASHGAVGTRGSCASLADNVM